MSWANAVTNTAIVRNAIEKNPAVLDFNFNLLCGYLLITQLSYVFDGPVPQARLPAQASIPRVRLKNPPPQFLPYSLAL